MANIKSAKKRILVNRTKYERNKAAKSAIKTAIKKVEVAVAEGNKEEATTALVNATKIIDKAGSKGIMHKNTAANKVSRLTKLVNSAK
ncbi:30S ribosomal protein S20 [Eubacterium sp.]|uniref:30S ribosomal protein S20 n=1 Tax=Eubacterium sp. TaxID=142586 RepID=UPI0025EDE3A5|nr:30S ribosomal protein S20 [Eubacterium sp.]MCR5628065.1 30S ribosomal protein S20 [Eubacterium sp.]